MECEIKKTGSEKGRYENTSIRKTVNTKKGNERYMTTVLFFSEL